MNFVISICFSPTGTTRRVVEGIIAGLESRNAAILDITKKAHRQNSARPFADELVIFATPVYYGRIPEAAAECFRSMTGNNTPAVLVVVYGNRAYDDALLELHDIAVDRGFIPIAAGAFIGEHSYSCDTLPIASLRPDTADLEIARMFGASIKEKLARYQSARDGLLPDVPGKRPYIQPEGLHLLREIRKTIPFAPTTDVLICTRCNRCAEACPQDAIDPFNISETNSRECIMCFACVKICPVNARQMAQPAFHQRVKEILEKCRERNEPEWYL
jgi:ferredoxin/flavodoxin